MTVAGLGDYAGNLTKPTINQTVIMNDYYIPASLLPRIALRYSCC